MPRGIGMRNTERHSSEHLTVQDLEMLDLIEI